DTESIDVSFADPVRVGCYQGIDDIRANCVVVICVVLQPGDVHMLVFRSMIKVSHLAATMVPVLVAQLRGNRPVSAAEIAERKHLVLEVEIRKSALVKPVVAGMVDDDVENDTDRSW